jgi:hypothetical protein
MVIGGETILLTEDFSSGVPPPGWTRTSTNWYAYYGTLAGGTSPECRFYWIPYGTTTSRLYTTIDTTGYGMIAVEFKQYLNHYGGPYTLSVDTSTDGVSWDSGWSMVNPTGFPAETVNFETTLNVGGLMWIAWTFDGDPFNLNYWHIDDIEVKTFQAYIMEGLGEASCEVLIANVRPIVTAPTDFVFDVPEMTTIAFEGFEIYDPAMMVETEEFWYRIDPGDGTGPGPWMYKEMITVDILEGFERNPSDWPWDPWVAVSPPLYERVHTGAAHDGIYGLEVDQGYGNMWYYRDDLGIGVPGDTLALWVRIPGYGPSMLDSGRAYLGFCADSSGCYSFQVAPNTNSIFFYDCHPYGAFNPMGPTVPYTFNHDGWYLAQMEFLPSDEVRGNLFDSDGTTLLATVTATVPGGYEPGGAAFRFFDYGYTPRHFYVDSYIAPCFDPVIPTFTYDYGDNGIYDVNVQVIDDDMMWDLSGPTPVFTGPGNEEDWISNNVFPVEVSNVDPEISPLRALVDLDLVIRTTGEPKNDCTMTLWKGTTALGSVTVHHDGNYKMETLPATLDMGMINDYYVTVEYENGDPDGANPTWVFEGRFPSGHIKELKNVFKEDGTLWTIGAEFLKDMIVGEEITFTADSSDVGSDDLAFYWQWGDGTEGIHVYANDDLSMVDGANGPPENVFDPHPSREPWFDKSPNTIRSPEVNPIHVDDEITHAFMEAGYYYVCLISMDDDVCDGYPSYQTFLNGGGYDMEFIEIDLA